MQIFGDIPNVHIVFDDVIVAATNDIEHDETFHAVLERARQNKVKFNRAKVQYKLQSA